MKRYQGLELEERMGPPFILRLVYPNDAFLSPCSDPQKQGSFGKPFSYAYAEWKHHRVKKKEKNGLPMRISIMQKYVNHVAS